MTALAAPPVARGKLTASAPLAPLEKSTQKELLQTFRD
jgi:hypothetical protein